MVLAGTTHAPSELLKDLKYLKIGSNCCFQLFGFVGLSLVLHIIVIDLDEIVSSTYQYSPPFVRTITQQIEAVLIY